MYESSIRIAGSFDQTPLLSCTPSTCADAGQFRVGPWVGGGREVPIHKYQATEPFIGDYLLRSARAQDVEGIELGPINRAFIIKYVRQFDILQPPPARWSAE